MPSDSPLDFSLPAAPGPGSGGSKLIILLLLVLIALAAANLYFVGRGKSAAGETNPSGSARLKAEQTKALASKLAQRNLYDEAGGVWQEYLGQADLDPTERANALFQIGTLLEKAEQYDRAITHFYRSEMWAKVPELESLIDSHIKTCFEKLGRFSALRYELMDRTSYKGRDDSSGVVVAQIGPEQITEADLKGLIESRIESQLAPMASFMPPDQLAEQKKRMLEQFQDKQAQQQVLRSYLVQEILYRQALEEDLLADEHVKKQISELTQDILAQEQITRQLASKINITEGDLKTYYSANLTQYQEPRMAQISHIRVAAESAAQAAISRIKEGASFAQLATELSLDETGKKAGGRIEADVVPGDFVPGMGLVSELNQAIFAAQPPALLDRPYETEQGWEIVQVHSIQPERQLSFDEVSVQVRITLANQKRQEVQEQYIRDMMDKFNVVIHTAQFQPAAAGATPPTPRGTGKK